MKSIVVINETESQVSRHCHAGDIFLPALLLLLRPSSSLLTSSFSHLPSPPRFLSGVCSGQNGHQNSCKLRFIQLHRASRESHSSLCILTKGKAVSVWTVFLVLKQSRQLECQGRCPHGWPTMMMTRPRDHQPHLGHREWGWGNPPKKWWC